MKGTAADTTGATLEEQLLRRLERARALEDLRATLLDPESRGSLLLTGVTASARTLVAAWLAREAAKRGLGPILYVVPDTTSLEEDREDFRFLLGGTRIREMTSLGIPPYSPQHPRIPHRAPRIETLASLLADDDRPWLVLTTVAALTMRVPEPERFRRLTLRLEVGQEADPLEVAHRLAQIGYENQPLVGEYGDMSRRGGILDVYSFGRENPVRIEWDGDRVTSIREFDVFSQRSVRPLREVLLLPVWEHLLTPEDWERLERRADLSEAVRNALESLRHEASFAGIEWMAPRLGLRTVPLTAYFGPGALAVAVDPLGLSRALREAAEEIRERRSAAPAAEGPGQDTAWTDLYAPPEEVFNIPEDCTGLLDPLPCLFLTPGERRDLPDDIPPRLLREGVDTPAAAAWTPPEPRATVPGTRRTLPTATLRTRPQEHFARNLELTREYISRLADRGLDVWILCDTQQHRDRLEELLAPGPARFEVGNLAAGFECPEIGLAVLTDHEIFQRTRRHSARRRFSRGISLKELLAMGPGDYVVHIDHGIGIYRGITRLQVNGQETDCMHIEYAGGGKLYVPVDQLDRVQRYSAEEGIRPQLSRLGSGQWQKTKARVKKSVKEMAAQLLRTYAIRKSRPGYAFGPDTVWQAEMEASFPYEETPDQAQAIEDVRRDMERPVPMERLICGDVGYGKTEVALRAAFKAAMDGKQVAILVPTTLLAQQHYETFRERLEKYPVRVELLSRFRSPKEQREVVEGLRKGTVDIVIGTHRLLQKDVSFKDLGLLIVDEEHRFGVAHKERLKQLKAEVDFLSMTATPIPRTLHMALMGAMDMSIIRTPPRDRRPIQTEIVEFREDVIAYALMREADRGGQSFFVHNRVESIEAMANYIRRIVPHLRVAVAHGQMRERQLERVMKAFLDGEYDVLVATMIIEAGLDMPNVNTILINRVDTFGLAQLYQLRGRVGRSSRKAYAYLLVPSNKVLTEAAQKRLKAIEEFEDLGSGFQLAMRDLEIRGAGNILGAEQHGFIVNVGFDLYTRLLEEAVRELKGLPAPERIEARIVTDLEAYFPDDYVPDTKEKMNLYKSLADTTSMEQVDELAKEIEDRFGRLPPQGENLVELRRLRILASQAGVSSVVLREGVLRLEMDRDLLKEEVHRLVAGMPFAVEFQTHGHHRVGCRIPRDVPPLAVARMVLESLDRRGEGSPPARKG
jgi:transcription-repair coupling factor (superfamily II helicase)